MIDKIIKIWLVVWFTIFAFAITYTIFREDEYRQEKEKIEYIKDMAQTRDRLELEFDMRYIDSLKQEINK